MKQQVDIGWLRV